MRAGLLLAIVLVLAGCGGGGTKTQTITVTHTVTHVRTVTVKRPTTTVPKPATSPCAGGSLSGSFDVVPGSAGAGQIVYRLTVTGSALPTSASAAQPGTTTAVRVSLQHGKSATADAQFSPDVNGTGDSTTGQCQPTATVMRVTAPGGGTLDAPIEPPTPVCERGSLHFKVFTASS